MYKLDCGRNPEEAHMLKGKVYTDLYQVAVYLYKHPGRWYSKEISGHTGVSHPSVYVALDYLREEALVDCEVEREKKRSRARRIYVELNQFGRDWVKKQILEKAKEILPLVEQEFQKG
jgi:DNA-binding PadR family transcriptional regulator